MARAAGGVALASRCQRRCASGRTAPGDIAAELALTPSTVSSHLARIRDKLGVRINGEVMQYAWRAGLATEG